MSTQDKICSDIFESDHTLVEIFTVASITVWLRCLTQVNIKSAQNMADV